MRSARTIALGLIGLVALALGVLLFLRTRDPGYERAPPASASGPSMMSPHTTISVAKLSSAKTPDNCADVTFWVAKPIDFKHLEERGFVVMKWTCAKTFKGQTVFATCTRSDKDVDGHGTADAIAYYYDLATVESDETYRGQCLGNGGSWTPKPQDDPEYVHARARMPVSKPHHEIDSLMELLP